MITTYFVVLVLYSLIRSQRIKEDYDKTPTSYIETHHFHFQESLLLWESVIEYFYTQLYPRHGIKSNTNYLLSVKRKWKWYCFHDKETKWTTCYGRPTLGLEIFMVNFIFIDLDLIHYFMSKPCDTFIYSLVIVVDVRWSETNITE